MKKTSRREFMKGVCVWGGLAAGAVLVGEAVADQAYKPYDADRFRRLSAEIDLMRNRLEQMPVGDVLTRRRPKGETGR